MSKENYIESALKWAKKRGLGDFKANIEGYETPTPFTREEEEHPYIPDITARKTGAKFYIEIATKTDDVPRRVSKWKLLSTLASMKGGKLYLLAPHGHKAFVKRILQKYDLNAQLVSLNSN